MTTLKKNWALYVCAITVTALMPALVQAQEAPAPEVIATQSAAAPVDKPVLLAQATPDGDMATVPRAEYEQLLRDVADLKNQVASMKQDQTAGTSMGGTTDHNWYLSASVGAERRADAKDKLGAATVFKNPGYFVNGALGRSIGNNFRIEGETGLLNNVNKREIVTGAFNEPARGNISLKTFMLNAYYDIPLNSSRFKPFIGAGIGVFQSEVHGLTSPTLMTGVPGFFGPTIVDTTSKFTVAEQLKVGVSYAATPKSDVFLNYRYLTGGAFRLTSATLGTLDVNRPKVQGLELGVRVKF